MSTAMSIEWILFIVGLALGVLLQVIVYSFLLDSRLDDMRRNMNRIKGDVRKLLGKLEHIEHEESEILDNRSGR